MFVIRCCYRWRHHLTFHGNVVFSMALETFRDEAAAGSFARNGFLLLVGDRQIEDPDTEIDLTVDPVVSFVKLVPLAGG
jgi:hypothetical protein